MVVQGKFTPVLSAAAGAAAGYYCFSFLGGAGTGQGALFFLFIPLPFLCLFRVLSRFPRSFSGNPRARRFMGLGEIHLAVFSAGLALGLGSAGAIPRNITLGLPEETVTGISGTLLEDPRVFAGGRGRAALSLSAASAAGGIRSSARGQITVFFPDETMPRLKDFGRGSLVYAEGNFFARKEGAPPGEGPRFQAVSVHINKPAPFFERLRTGIRMGISEKFTGEAARRGSFRAGENWGGLALALLMGIRDNLDTDLAGLYQKAGCSHILALSGMHLAILSSLIAFCLKKPLGLKAASILGAVFIILYVLLIGSQPSLNRAALMYLLGTLAVLGALPRRPGVLLALAFLVQIILWPESGLTISFILSYLALGGILTIGEALYEICRGKIPELILRPLGASLGAFLATAGVTAFFFGTLRPVGIIAGLVIAPLTTVFMTGSLAFLALTFLIPPLAPLGGKALSLLYVVMDKLVSLAAKVPGIRTPRPFWLLGLTLGLAVFILWFGNRYGRSKRRVPSFA
jgi:competence protein ComEC